MSYVGLTLGLLGSFHCLLMCGPLVLGVSRTANLSGYRLVAHSVVYNLGRIMAYVVLGVLFSMIGEAFAVAGLQQMLSVGTGILLILLLIASLDIEKFLFKFQATRSLYQHYLTFITNRIRTMARDMPAALGFLNGLLPCGMVYIALAGTLTAQSISQGVLFMLSFGLGTLPMMLATMIGASSITNLKKFNLKKAIPIGQAFLGIYLIFRGMMMDVPANLSF